MQFRRTKRALDGVILVDKPSGLSSNDVLQKVKRIYQAAKAGHTGALDPLATGMLPICFGEATKFSQYLLDADKRYRVIAKLGQRTDTSDADGQIVSEREVAASLTDIEHHVMSFVGDIMQVPSMFSALKYQGRPLYEYARKGIFIEREPRPITVYSIEIKHLSDSELTLDIHCSKGTYIRTIVDDLGEKLGCGAHVIYLRRLRVGLYSPDEMRTLEQLQADADSQGIACLDRYLLPTDSPVMTFPQVNLPLDMVEKLLHGQSIKGMNHLLDVGQFVRLFDSHSQRFLGVGQINEGKVLVPKRLVATESLVER